MLWILWVAAALGAAMVLWWMYNLIVAEPADLPPQAMVGSDPADAAVPDLARWYAPLVGGLVVPGNTVEHLRNGDEIFPAMLEAIDEASDSVHFLTYVYWTGDVAGQFADALKAAAERGCEVRVILDAAGAFKMDRAVVGELRDAGCEVEWFHPFGWYSLRRINHRTHRKVLVVDGRIAFTGGVGIAEEWEGDARHAGEWRDDHFRIEGPAVHGAQGAFAENWLNATGRLIADNRYYPDLSKAGDARVVCVATARREDMSRILVLYWLALSAARESVEITTPYFLPDPALMGAFKQAVDRGVRVRLLVPNNHNDSRIVRWTSQTLYPELLSAGVEIHEFQPTMIHSKVTLIDDRWSIVGSSNYDNRSFELNHEFTLLVDDASLNRKLRSSFETDLEHASRVEAANRVGVTWWKRRVGAVGLVVREQL